ncbi:transglycosylase SLT domain-containing protein [Pseudoroseomonas ludipueritiae]|uniref:Transglycosylase SLT domain-containing protein n=1 Tax=Pseudoroseomonas ludipueritiae TaxID=198093 RepID=A0ABR7R5J2_9PROT|nr:transglycosylase SLT domain-containing protein [Pseudoroseomonas ludipueritiae]MBC9176938.1 transglycosylase SLT domain-containing protein [Pseudoroseomonas ludipueritiae]
MAVLGFILLQQGAALAASPPPRKMEDLCRPAAMAAEIDAELPQGILMAIARVESGRMDPASGAAIPWPWTINAEGVPMVFNTREEAVAAVEALQARNVRLIDVGCMQVNLHHHPDAFGSLAEAFDPAANARYAARFLIRLRGSSGTWETAIGRYHSSTPGLSEAYRDRVLAAWTKTSRRSLADLRRDRVAAAWADARRGEGRAGQATATDQERPRASRDPVEQIAALWQRSRPDDGAERLPAASMPRARLVQGPAFPARTRLARSERITAR